MILSTLGVIMLALWLLGLKLRHLELLLVEASGDGPTCAVIERVLAAEQDRCSRLEARASGGAESPLTGDGRGSA
jgi:hypothetical protein